MVQILALLTQRCSSASFSHLGKTRMFHELVAIGAAVVAPPFTFSSARRVKVNEARGGGIGGGGLLFRQAKFAELNNGLNVSMRINGNTTIKCGETINLSVPITGRVHSKEFDQYYSGKYLITKLRHSFDIATKRHEILCVAAKDAISEGLEQRSQAIEPLGKIGTIDNLTY